MQTYKRSCFAAIAPVLTGATVVLAAGNVWAQCSELTSGLRFPLGIAGSNQGNLLVAETGSAGIPNSGRISVVGLSGNRRTLLDGLPWDPTMSAIRPGRPACSCGDELSMWSSASATAVCPGRLR